MSAPDILTVARWLQDRHGIYQFAVDHPGRPECGGSHRECDGQRGKHPRGQWSRLATLSPRLIRAQLAGGPWNIGIACKQSCLLVVDEDRPGAFAAFAASTGQAVEPTFAVDTAKGRHWYYRQGEGAPLGNSRGRLAGHGIDIRGGGSGNGGYVVGPGSVHETGVVYTPVDPALPIQSVPGWLAEALRPVQPPEPSRAAGRPSSTFGTLRGLIRVVLEGVPGVDRNDRLFWASCRAAEMVEAGQVDQPTAEAVLIDAALRAGLRGGEPEARRTVASGLRAVTQPSRGGAV
jgi:Bifunctional DNA primase/polymerase, N-terminal